MNAKRYSEAALLVARGATMQRISRTILGNLPLPIPPFDTQKHISNYLDQKTDQLDSLIFNINEQIEKLKEYRQAIISEVITGKVTV
jgi:type I restriction enzyme S subunit